MKNAKKYTLTALCIVLVIAAAWLLYTSELYYPDGLYYSRVEMDENGGWVDMYLSFHESEEDPAYRIMDVYLIYNDVGDEESMPATFEKITYRIYGERQKKLIWHIYLSTLPKNHVVVHDHKGNYADIVMQILSACGYDRWYNKLDEDVESGEVYRPVCEYGDGYLILDGARFDSVPKPYNNDESLIYSLDHYGE